MSCQTSHNENLAFKLKFCGTSWFGGDLVGYGRDFIRANKDLAKYDKDLSGSLRQSLNHMMKILQRKVLLEELGGLVSLGFHMGTLPLDPRSSGKLRGFLDFMFSITHHSVFITHNSKLVGPMVEGCVWICFQFLFPSLNSLIFE